MTGSTFTFNLIRNLQFHHENAFSHGMFHIKSNGDEAFSRFPFKHAHSYCLNGKENKYRNKYKMHKCGHFMDHRLTIHKRWIC